MLLAVLGAGYFAYSKGYLAIPGITPKSDQLFDKMVDSISDIKNAQYSLRLSIKGEPRSSDATPIFLNANTNVNGTKKTSLSNDVALADATNTNSGTNSEANGSANTNAFVLENVGSQVGLGEAGLGDSYLGAVGDLVGLSDSNQFFSVVPGDVNLTGGMTIYFEADKKLSEANGSIRIDGAYTGGDVSVSVDLEARKKGSDLYGIINKFPSFFFIDTSALKGKWVKMSPDDGTDVLDEDMFDQVDTVKFINALKTNLKRTLQAKVFTVKKQLPTEAIGGVQSQHYLIAIDPTKLVDVYDAYIKEQQAKGIEDTVAKEVRNGLKDPKNMATLQRIVDNTRMEVWVDKVNGFLRQTSWELTIVPPDGNERLKGRQFVLGMKLTLEKVNQPVSIDAPSPTIGIDEAERLITGITKEEQQAQKQMSRTRELQTVLKAYQSKVGSFPDSLDQLTPKMREWNAQCTKDAQARNANVNKNGNSNSYDDVGMNGEPYYDYNCYTYKQYAKKPVNTTDVYTGKPYSYRKDGSDFKVTYQLLLGNSTKLSYEKEAYAEGTNTMTSTDVSLEKETAYEQYQREHPVNTNTSPPVVTPPTDTDHDGLTDVQERTIYLTNPNVADTDGDGISDGDEVKKFTTNPNLKDSDADGYDDKTEIDSGYNPLGPGMASETLFDSWHYSASQKGGPVITNAKTTTNGSTVTFSWTTDTLADSKVMYGTTTAYDTSIGTPSDQTAHSFTQTLQSGTYHYQIRSCSPSPTVLCTVTADQTFSVPSIVQ